MSDQKKKKEVANNFALKTISEQSEKIKVADEEKVEVEISEIIRIRPQDFQSFKHAFEDFVNNWDL